MVHVLFLILGMVLEYQRFVGCVKVCSAKYVRISVTSEVAVRRCSTAKVHKISTQSLSDRNQGFVVSEALRYEDEQSTARNNRARLLEEALGKAAGKEKM